MTDVQLHFRGQGGESCRLPAMPRRGDYLNHDGKLFVVSVVVINEAVNVYAVPVSDTLADELRQQWAFWDKSPASYEPIDAQRNLLQRNGEYP